MVEVPGTRHANFIAIAKPEKEKGNRKKFNGMSE